MNPYDLSIKLIVLNIIQRIRTGNTNRSKTYVYNQRRKEYFVCLCVKKKRFLLCVKSTNDEIITAQIISQIYAIEEKKTQDNEKKRR